MPIKKTLALATIFAALMLQTNRACADFINGDFSVLVPTNGTGGGWTSTDISSGGWQASFGNPGGNFILNGDGNAATIPTISQALNTFVVSQTYRISGQYSPFAVAFGNPNAFSFGVFVDGGLVLQLQRGAAGVFTNFSVDFVATNATHTIAFSAEINGDDSSYRVDNLSVQLLNPQAVPEPSSMILLGLGLGVAGCFTLRRRRATTHVG